MSAYEELVEHIRDMMVEGTGDAVDIVALILRTLETVTPEMANDVGLQPIAARAVFLAMLHASPLVPPK